MRIGVVGAREGRTQKEVFAVLKDLVKPQDVIISGGALGVDYFAMQFATDNKIELKQYLPIKELYPGRDPYNARNEEIAKDSDIVLAFPTKSGGTWNTIAHTLRHNKRLIIF